MPKEAIVSILGTDYEVTEVEYEKESLFEEREMDGYCDVYLKRIVICKKETHPLFKHESLAYCRECEKHVLKHEIIHAFFNESGLKECTSPLTTSWAVNEEMIDWIAVQGEKIVKAWTDAIDILCL